MKLRKTHLLLILTLCIATGVICYTVGRLASSRKTRIPYNKWQQVQFKDVRLLIASDSRHACQGFAGAEEKDFEKTLMIFPDIIPGTAFTNADQGFGPVTRDLKIVYLDSKMNVLKEDAMKKETGISTAPPGTFIAIEGLLP